ncbi:GNAT family N-acetyltransferase [Maribacter chungangensis]|uniref:GNAT family N-acetyltransferase n=1 Tax=Maribacter chungangensis TaxID=1069117 RepID=A0ABW3B5T2_9FLAO
MTIINSTSEDINEIFRLYKQASDYQRTREGVVVWPTFERNVVATELAEKRQFKLIINNSVACIWAVTFMDADIWEERNADAAVYIHRIATNPEFRGHNFVATIVAWAKDYARANDKRFVRLDTVGNNSKLIAHYTRAGFSFLGLFDLQHTDTLPAHYKEAPVSLFEINLNTQADNKASR